MTPSDHNALRTCHPERSASSAQQAVRAAEGSLPSLRALWAKASRVRRLTFAVLREIFDESAYTRFLDRHHLTPSRGSYAAFRREHEPAKTYRPRCC
jgi:hypothetical protein